MSRDIEEETNENREPLNTTLMHINIVIPTLECSKEMYLARDVQEAKRITCGRHGDQVRITSQSWY
jgi:hypothetical protein